MVLSFLFISVLFEHFAISITIEQKVRVLYIYTQKVRVSGTLLRMCCILIGGDFRSSRLGKKCSKIQTNMTLKKNVYVYKIRINI